LSSPWRTGLKEEALDALPEIMDLARDVLPSHKIEEANKISQMLMGSKQEEEYAKAKLTLEVGLKPTRPLLYLMPLFQRLPRLTRDCIRYLGDYIDLLTKELTFEYTGNRKARKSSLGKNALNLLKSQTSPEIRDLAEKLLRYNKFLYSPGKHDFSLPPGRKHRFTAKEVVLTTYVTAALAEQIKSISRFARIAVEKDNLYTIGGRWRSRNRVEYVGDH